MRAVRSREVEPVALHEKALENLTFIRDTMARTAHFTAVSGLGSVAMGGVALLAASVASTQQSPVRWLVVWLSAAAISFVVSALAVIRKARTTDTPLFSGAGRKFLLSLLPALAVGAGLTWPLFVAGEARLLPAVWLLLYGTAVMAAGAFSVRVVPAMGLSFMLVGAAALFSPVGTGDLFMAAGFGGLHLIFGLIIWRRYGG